MNQSTYRQRLMECMQRVPPAVNSGSYQTAIKFKEWAGEAKKALSNSRTTDHTFQSLISRYESWK